MSIDATTAPRLIASDIDGTLLDRNHRVPIRNREAVARAVASGAEFALATGRPFRWICLLYTSPSPRDRG